MGWTGFGCDEGAQGRAKEKHSGFGAVPSFIPCRKLHCLNSLLGVCLRSCISYYRHNKIHLYCLFYICFFVFFVVCLEVKGLGLGINISLQAE